ncbi:MFS transporter, partial [Candidatus Microgenomates bacterium]|nr:MFS transporter [Candidatus Microgenomates bacterium]
MASLRHLYIHIQTYGMKHKHLYLLSLMFFFWKIFDGIVSYVTPLVITEAGFSKTAMGLIYSSSSVFGAIFDIVLSRYLKNSNYRRIFIILFAISFAYPLILWQAKTVFVYIIAMAIWGLYYDLATFGTFDFVSRKLAPEEHTSSFGVIDVFRAIGTLVAPIIAGLIIVELVDWKSYAAALFFLAIAFMFFIQMLIHAKKSHYEYIKNSEGRKVSLFKEIDTFKKVFRKVSPMVIITSLIFLMDAFFWTIGPIFSETYKQVHPLNGMFLAAYSLPTLLMGWFIGNIAKKYGKNKTTYISFLLGSIVLTTFAFVGKNPFALFAAVLVFSTFLSITLTTSHS